jgi:hypothetical protein
LIPAGRKVASSRSHRQLPATAGFTPDADGTDSRGCANVLAEDRSAPCGATTYNTNLVEVVAVR